MFFRLIRRARIELSHFRKLRPDVRKLLLSYSFFLAAWPLVMVFLNAYLWRMAGGLWSVAAYNTGYIIGLPVGFYINGFLLRKFHILRLYLTGSLLQGIPAALAVFMALHAPGMLLVYGTVYGIGAGIFWGNKNYLDQQLTRGTNRVYYNSLGQIADLLLNIIVPAVTGWFIVLMGTVSLTDAAYRGVMMAGFILFLLSGLTMQSAGIRTPGIRGLTVRRPGSVWSSVRRYNLVYNTQVGLNLIMSSVLVLMLVGGEGVLGTVQSVTAMLSAALMYIIGRKSTPSNVWRLIGVGSVVLITGASVLAGKFTWIGALVYSAATTVTWSLQWPPGYSVLMDVMDRVESDPEKQYAYVCDNEAFFNIGRGIGIALLMMSVAAVGQNMALRWIPLAVAVIQIPLMWQMRTLSEHATRRAVPIAVPESLSQI